MIAELNIKAVIAVLATLLVVFGAFFPYIRDILKKTTKPHAYTWLIWAITQGTAVAGLLYGGGGWGGLLLVVGTISVFIVFLLSLKYGTKNITKSDTAILISAFLAIIVWWQLNQPLLSVLMVTAIDLLGYIPTFRKTFEEPWTETPSSWTIFSIGNVLSIFALNEYNLLTMTYLVLVTIANIAVLAICLTRRKIIPRPA